MSYLIFLKRLFLTNIANGGTFQHFLCYICIWKWYDQGYQTWWWWLNQWCSGGDPAEIYICLCRILHQSLQKFTSVFAEIYISLCRNLHQSLQNFTSVFAEIYISLCRILHQSLQKFTSVFAEMESLNLGLLINSLLCLCWFFVACFFLSKTVIIIEKHLCITRLQKKISGKSLVFCQTPLGPPPPLSFFLKKKIYPYFLVENCIFNGRNEFYAWSHFKNK